MKKISLLTGLFCLLSVCFIHGQNSAKPVQKSTIDYLFIGTYTKKTSEGIYVYKFNNQTGDLTPVSVAKNIKNPSYLAISPNKKFVYSVGENDADGAVNAFSFDKKSGELTFLDTQSSGGSGPCYVSVDNTGKWVLVGNYGAGSLSILPIQANGSVGKPTQTIQDSGKSVVAGRQDAPHVHSVNIAANNKDIFVPDLGLDKIMVFQLDDKSGQLTPGNPAAVTAKPGAGPRHFVFHPHQKIAYVIDELDATVTAYHYKNNTLEPFQTISTIPADYTGQKWCADIHISADGKFLYGSNRAHESLVIYSVNQKDGKLTLVGHQNVMGKTPRNFIIDASGNFILVANQDSDNITVFKRNKQTGKLTFTGKEIKVSMPVCLKMMPAQ